MCLTLFKNRSSFTNKYIFWDTNCYRYLGRQANQNGIIWLDNKLRQIKQNEAKQGIKIKVAYLVLAEMYAHLDEEIDSPNYLECKNGLYAALFHSDFDISNMLHNADNEFCKFIIGKAPLADSYREESLYKILLLINEKAFNDAFIKQNSNSVILAKNYLQKIKDNWKDSFVNYFIRKHDISYTGNWQVFLNDETKRSKLLSELRKAKKNNLVMVEFGIGMYEYLKNNLPNEKFPDLDNNLLESIILRFKPLFDLQYRILEFICQSGYNLQTKQNDITDYLIIASLETDKSIFVSMESKNLVPNLHSFGYKKDVLLFDKYLNNLSIKIV